MRMSIISNRKKEVTDLLSDIEAYPSTNKFRQEMMSFSYVLVCGTIEFMTESIIREWLSKTIRHHKTAPYYRGRKYIQHFLDTQSQAREDSIEKFNSTALNRTKELIKNVAGEAAREKFNQLLQTANQSAALQPDINGRLERITRLRHELAHGQKMPNDLQPNVSELKEDFGFIYKHIIVNIQKCLPRV